MRRTRSGLLVEEGLVGPGDWEFEEWREAHPPIAGGAGWSWVQGTSFLSPSSPSTLSVAITPLSNVTTGNVLAIGISTGYNGTQNYTIADTGSNSWTKLAEVVQGPSGVDQAIFFCVVNAGSNGTKPTITVSWTGSSTILNEIYFAEFTTPGGTISQDGTATHATGTGSNVVLPAGGGSGANDLVLTLVTFGVNFTSWGGSWASFDSVNTSQNGDTAGYLLNAAGNSTPNVNQASSGAWADTVVCLQAGVGGSGTVPTVVRAVC